MKVTIETTARCPRAPILLFAVEECEVDYDLVIRPDGYFEQTYGTIGPVAVVDDEPFVGLDTALRAAAASLLPEEPERRRGVDRWLEAHATTGRDAYLGVVRGMPDGRAGLERWFGHMAEALENREFLEHTLTLADCHNVAAILLQMQFGVEPQPRRFADYVRELAARPAWQRTARRLSDARNAAGPAP